MKKLRKATAMPLGKSDILKSNNTVKCRNLNALYI